MASSGKVWIDCNCNCNWGTCIAPPTRRPIVHHRVICILVPIDSMKQKCFQITTKWVCWSQQFRLHEKRSFHMAFVSISSQAKSKDWLTKRLSINFTEVPFSINMDKAAQNCNCNCQVFNQSVFCIYSWKAASPKTSKGLPENITCMHILCCAASTHYSAGEQWQNC